MTPIFVDICPPIISVEKKQSQLESFNFTSLGEEQTCFVEAIDSDIKKLVANAVHVVCPM